MKLSKLLWSGVVSVFTASVLVAATISGPLLVNGVVTSKVATGTAPLTVASTTEVANLRAATATALATGRTINGVSFDGTANVTVTAAAATLTGLGTGVATALGVNVGSAGAPVVNGGALGTPSSGTLTSATGLPISTGVSGLGTGLGTALGLAPTGSGVIVLATNAVLTTPTLGVASATSMVVTNSITSDTVNAYTTTTTNLYIKEGWLRLGSGGTLIYEIKHGRATLSAGVAVVNYTGTTTASRIMLGVYTPGGTRGFLDTGTRIPGTSFTITSSSVLDTSVIDWVVINP